MDMTYDTASAHDTILRLALAMYARDPKSDATAPQRAWIRDRLQRVTADGQCLPLTAQERARMRGPLVAYMATNHPRIEEIVTQQFDAGLIADLGR